MPSIDVLIAFTAASLLLNISPGPSNLYVMARSISLGTKGGMVAAAGLAAGSLVHVVATVLGLSVVFSHAPLLYTLIKLAGAIYLIYLGISHWKSVDLGASATHGPANAKPLSVVFRESVIVEVTNPKTVLFFVAFLPQFVMPESGPVAQQLLILGTIVTLSGLPCDLLVALFSSKVSDWLASHQRRQLILQRVSGSILFAMGCYLIADEARTA
jgi:threonine/homoserine/homoserine lactone efflux protein